MAATGMAQPLGQAVGQSAPQQVHDCSASVLNTYTAAMSRSKDQRGAFAEAVRTYLLYNPNMPEEPARLAVARIISSKE
jgi:hypothetical protein